MLFITIDDLSSIIDSLLTIIDHFNSLINNYFQNNAKKSQVVVFIQIIEKWQFWHFFVTI